MRGQFVVVEALDGVGKTTLVRNVAERLGWLAMDTPGPAIRPIREQVLAGLGDHQEARCLFYAATVLAQGRRATALAAEGQSVIMDRYWLSTIAYARARGVRAALDSIAAEVPLPTATVLLTLDEKVRRRRLVARGMTAADVETLDVDFAETVMEAMQDSTHLGPTFILDVTGLTPPETASALLARLGCRAMRRTRR